MTKYEGKNLTKATFVVEDSYFVNCELHDCDLFYSGGDFEFLGNIKLDNCRFHWRGPALKTLQLMQAAGMLKVGPLPAPSQVNIAKAN